MPTDINSDWQHVKGAEFLLAVFPDAETAKMGIECFKEVTNAKK